MRACIELFGNVLTKITKTEYDTIKNTIKDNIPVIIFDNAYYIELKFFINNHYPDIIIKSTFILDADNIVCELDNKFTSDSFDKLKAIGIENITIYADNNRLYMDIKQHI